MKKISILLNGIIKENPVFALVLGTCPTLAVTDSATRALGMGISTAAVLICSNLVISSLRKIIPKTIRIPAYIVIIAGFVSIVQMLLEAYFPALFASLGIYLSLIVVNCIILGRAEMFAKEHTAIESVIDGVGMGMGFTLALILMAIIREFFGNGSVFGFGFNFIKNYTIPFFLQPPGGFFVFGSLIALISFFAKRKHGTRGGCENCAQNNICGKGGV